MSLIKLMLVVLVVIALIGTGVDQLIDRVEKRDDCTSKVTESLLRYSVTMAVYFACVYLVLRYTQPDALAQIEAILHY